ncbi:hypothetical protein PAXRUDRAFT_152300, partial [Paxillus rubicundulus Ve08.2h10]
KKYNKFHITVRFMCNATGTEKCPIFHVGESKQPCCFSKRSPANCGFWHCNNETAWMTSVIFE